jgi:hypothetical protein
MFNAVSGGERDKPKKGTKKKKKTEQKTEQKTENAQQKLPKKEVKQATGKSSGKSVDLPMADGKPRNILTALENFLGNAEIHKYVEDLIEKLALQFGENALSLKYLKGQPETSAYPFGCAVIKNYFLVENGYQILDQTPDKSMQKGLLTNNGNNLMNALSIPGFEKTTLRDLWPLSQLSDGPSLYHKCMPSVNATELKGLKNWFKRVWASAVNRVDVKRAKRDKRDKRDKHKKEYIPLEYGFTLETPLHAKTGVPFTFAGETKNFDVHGEGTGSVRLCVIMGDTYAKACEDKNEDKNETAKANIQSIRPTGNGTAKKSVDENGNPFPVNKEILGAWGRKGFPEFMQRFIEDAWPRMETGSMRARGGESPAGRGVPVPNPSYDMATVSAVNSIYQWDTTNGGNTLWVEFYFHDKSWEEPTSATLFHKDPLLPGQSKFWVERMMNPSKGLVEHQKNIKKREMHRSDTRGSPSTGEPSAKRTTSSRTYRKEPKEERETATKQKHRATPKSTKPKKGTNEQSRSGTNKKSKKVKKAIPYKPESSGSEVPSEEEDRSRERKK